MAVKYYPTIWCDIDECVEWISSEGRDIPKKVARERAAWDGWGRLGTKDVCPRHRHEAGIPRQPRGSSLEPGITFIPISELPTSNTMFRYGVKENDE
jgi:hypothetical protein